MRDVTRDHMPALHNCGPGPNSVYRTAPAGSVLLLDLFAEIRQCSVLPLKLRTPFVPAHAEFDEQLPHPNPIDTPPVAPQVIVPLLAAVYAGLPQGASSTRRHALIIPSRPAVRPAGVRRGEHSYTLDDALSGIRQIAAQLRTVGCLVAPSALASWVPRTDFRGSPFERVQVGQPLPWFGTVIGPQSRYAGHAPWMRLAWLLCAFSYAAPPLVLFSREPSLRFWRADGGLSVRWLGTVEGVA